MRNKSPSFLIINPFGIGDVLFSTALIRNLRDNFPESKIFYLCNRRADSILSSHLLIHKTFIYERDEFEGIKKKSKLLWFRAFREFISQIRKEEIDICLDLSLNSQFGFFAWLAGIKKRFGLNYKKRGRFLTKKIPISGYEDKHVAEYYLDLLRLLDIEPQERKLEITVDPECKTWADKFIDSKGLRGVLIIGVAPCGGQAFGKDAYIKRWPEANFSALVKRLVDELGAKIFIFAGPGEKKETFNIINLSQRPQSCFEFTDYPLEKIVALVEKCSLFIGNDTGPLRFANAFSKKIVALFGPVDDKVYGLYPHDSGKYAVLKKDLPCRPCYKKFKLPLCPYDKKCLRDIKVDEVLEAVRALI
ncbi:MAG: glycosyltransferase family 9 protein [Candidatus Omnitrophica bacterium]|nr:glycosyltransferase family 9 protein [Candidatus Omnitrophota bacterium]